LEIEDNVYVPQCVEDLFFIAQRSVERSLGADSASIAMAVGNHTIALVDRQQDSKVYTLLTNNKTFHRCKQRREIQLPWKTAGTNAKKNTPWLEDPIVGKCGTPAGASAAVTVTRGEAEAIESTVGGSVASDLGAELAEIVVNKLSSSGLADIASAGFAGMNTWLLNFTSESNGSPDSKPSRPSSNTPLKQSSAPSSGNGLGTFLTPKSAPSSSLKLDELLIQALEEDVHYGLEDNEDIDARFMSLDDNCVRLSSITIGTAALDNLIIRFSMLMDTRSYSYLGEKEKSQLGALSIIIQELSRCKQDYTDDMQYCGHQIVSSVFSEQLEGKLRTLMSR
jgi:hypothetical protein